MAESIPAERYFLDVSQGCRLLASPARGAKQPLLEPTFIFPRADLQCSKLALPKILPKEDPNITMSTAEFLALDDSDQQGQSDSDSFSRSSSEEEHDTQEQSLDDTSITVMNEKSHVVHAAHTTTETCVKRSFFMIKKTFEVFCGSSVVDAPIKILALIPHDSKICQRKARLSAMTHFFK